MLCVTFHRLSFWCILFKKRENSVSGFDEFELPHLSTSIFHSEVPLAYWFNPAF